MKIKNLLLCGFVLALGIGAGVYFTQYYPEQAEARQLEKQIQRDYYGGTFKLSDSEEKEITPERLRVLAEKGYAVAQYGLAEFYQENENNTLAKKWYEKAAEQKMARAYVKLADLEENQSDKKALLEKASALGDAEADYDLAMIFYLENDELTAAMLAEKSAKAGYFQAMSLLPGIYREGIGVKQNWEKAFDWSLQTYRQAKALNVAAVEPAVVLEMKNTNLWLEDTYKQLAIFYLLGIGTEKNEAKAQQLLAERNALLQDAVLKIFLKTELTLDELKAEILTMDIPKAYQERVAILEAEMNSNRDPEFWLKLGEKTEDQTKAKGYFGSACDFGSQKGCDKYREINEKEMKNE
ncbi:hypothetical protein BKG91_04530 [Rodentibacter caecimuris]|uniref:Sel1 repeat family protein n=1 Tax=Rodentibacter caecimuris TaxID=1796644 RepID=A0AAJ3N0Y2_9PAST|nr:MULTISPECIES: sel1 repeat family protein [Pasteurellaceae]AOF52907.1 hypothetical protein AC062_0812 [Pasteurellaceae bacterium NI1060]MCR1837104.1 sel1 repeat family protein [Pasteurella caecimuris]MCU0106706.1 sel1 repeat family protein [Pasteurella caecimuris]MCX2961274.1 sel1 repeat family protein [Rodentibacter heylii]OOF72902.1 hypothetical protein BKG90_03090 [Rodentibacter heylii]